LTTEPGNSGAFIAVGALRAWQERVRCDPQSRLTDNALHAAACMEANGNDAARDGLPATAEAWYRDAAEVLITSAKRRAA
jgi:hypothetical protein